MKQEARHLNSDQLEKTQDPIDLKVRDLFKEKINSVRIIDEQNIPSQIAELTQQLNAVTIEKNALAQKNTELQSCYDVAITEKNKAYHAYQMSLKGFSQINEDKEKLLSDKSASLEFLSKKNHENERHIQLLEKKISELNNQLALRNHVFTEQISGKNIDYQKMNKELLNKENKISFLEDQYEGLQRQIEVLNTQKNLEIQNINAENKILKDKVDQARMGYIQEINDLKNLVDLELVKNKNLLDQINAKEDNFKVLIQLKDKEIFEKNSLMQKIQLENTETIRTISENLSLFQAKNEELLILNLDLQNKNECLNAEILNLQERVGIVNQALKQKDLEIDSIKNLNQISQDQLIAELDKVKNDYFNLLTKAQDTDIRLKSTLAQLSAEELLVAEKELEIVKLKDKLVDLNNTHLRYDQFAMVIRQERNKIIEQLNQLDYEINKAKTIHPLMDYLKATEYEMQKVELQLKKTPASSVDRKKIENLLEQLFNQRNHLQNLIKESNSALSRLGKKVKSLESEADVLLLEKLS